jgi:L-cysteate sulfo-lyase
MKLDQLPRISLGFFPTPLHRLPKLSQSGLFTGPMIWVKRDDLTGLATGGNKTRKLEFLVADAIARQATTLVTIGAAQSNHARQTAAAAAKVGLRSALVLRGAEPHERNGNLLLDELINAEIYWAGERTDDEALQQTAAAVKTSGGVPYVIPLGGSTPIGAVGYVTALLELMEQSKALGVQFDAIVFATSSGGTQSGLAVGAKMAGYAGRLVGISVDHHADDLVPVLVDLAQATARHIDQAFTFTARDFDVNDQYLGGGYGIMGEPEREAIRTCARYEGLLVDPVYTGRAMAGLLDLLTREDFYTLQNVLFWHTGGTPALFAYASQLTSVD